MLKGIIIIFVLMIILFIILLAIYFKNVHKIQEELNSKTIQITDTKGKVIDVTLSGEKVDGEQIDASGDPIEMEKPQKPGAFNVLGQVKYINQNFANYKCHPMIMPLVGTAFGPPGTSASKNYAACEASKTLSTHKMLDMGNVDKFNKLSNITASMNKDINKARQMTNYVRTTMKNDFDEAYSKVKENWTRVMKLYTGTRKVIGDLVTIFEDTIAVGIYGANALGGIPNNGIFSFLSKL